MKLYSISEQFCFSIFTNFISIQYVNGHDCSFIANSFNICEWFCHCGAVSCRHEFVSYLFLFLDWLQYNFNYHSLYSNLTCSLGKWYAYCCSNSKRLFGNFAPDSPIPLYAMIVVSLPAQLIFNYRLYLGRNFIYLEILSWSEQN